MNKTDLPDFLVIPSKIIKDQDLQPLDGYVYGVIYWYKGMKLQKCFASSEDIGKRLSSSEGSIQNSINRLIKKGHIMSIYHRSKHQRELIPMVTINGTTSNDVMAPHQMMSGTTSNDVSTLAQIGTPNNNIKKEYINNTGNNKKKGFLDKLPIILKDIEHIAYLVDLMAKDLHDSSSTALFTKIAMRIPEGIILQTLAEVKADGAENPAKLFTYKIQRTTVTKSV